MWYLIVRLYSLLFGTASCLFSLKDEYVLPSAHHEMGIPYPQALSLPCFNDYIQSYQSIPPNHLPHEFAPPLNYGPPNCQSLKLSTDSTELDQLHTQTPVQLAPIPTIPQQIPPAHPISFKCTFPHCTKTFMEDNQLRTHQEIHEKRKEFGCGSCGLMFLRRHDLKRHQRIHEVFSVLIKGVKPYVCQRCQKGFSRKDGLKRHLNMDENVKEYRCRDSR